MNGLFYFLSKTAIKDVIDGTSHTLMGSETIVIKGHSPGQFDCRGAYYWGVWGGTLFTSLWPPNTNNPDRLDEPKLCIHTPQTPCHHTGDMVNFARSRHPSGVNAVMADGAVRFVSDFIDVPYFQAMGKPQWGRGGGDKVRGNAVKHSNPKYRAFPDL